MKSLRKTLLILFALFAFGQWTSAQTQYINQLMLIGDYEGVLIDSNVQIYQENGWTLVDYNLNEGTNSDQIIYLLYKTGLVDDPEYAPITDFYIKSTSDKNDHPDEISYGDRTYHRIAYPNVVGSDSFIDSYGDLNDGAGGKYIYLYYTTDAWDYPRGISEISFNSTSDGAVCGNGGTEPQDLNEGAHGDYIYMHYKYAMTIDVIEVYDHSDLSPLNATCSDTLHFRLADDVANNEVITSSNINVGNNNIAVIDLNGKYLGRLIQSGGGTDAGHVFKVIGNSTLIIVDNSTNGTGVIATGDADRGGAFYIDASGKLIIESGTVESCHADYGGAIYNLGTLTINGGTIQNCYATRGWGQGIIYNNGTLTINGGTIQNNTAYYGGAIYNVYGWTTTINGGVIQNNNAIVNNGYYTDDGVGGGILNYGIFYINGGTIQGNSCGREGGGIWMTNEGGLFMQGNPVIKDNKLGSDANNVYVPNEDKVINVVGEFTEGACIGVTPQTSDERITYNYSVHNGDVDPARIFFSDNGYFVMLNANNEVVLDPSISVMEANYIDANGNEAFYSNCFPLSHISDETTSVTLNDGWYLVDADKSFTHRIDMYGNINLILGDGYELEAINGFEIKNDESSLTIYCQSGHSGRLVSDNLIGDMNRNGTITINGGIVISYGGISATAINLNWTDYSLNTAEQIEASYYNGTVTLQKYFIDDDEIVYNPGVVDDNNILELKILKPYPVYDVNIGTIVNGSFTASPNQAHEGWTVTLEGTPDAGYPLCSEITVTGMDTGDNVTVTRIGNTNVFEFVMPREAVNVNAKFDDKILVDYIDYYGETQTVPATVVIDNGEHDIYLNNGWYVVNNDIYSDMFCDVMGDDVNLILSDGKTLWLNEDFYFTQENNHLIVWGQSVGTGKIHTVSIANPNWACRITINGGVVEAQAGNTGVAIGGPDAIVTINGGAVYASQYDGTIKFNRFYEDTDENKYAGEYTGSELDNLKNKWLNPCDNVFVKEGEWNVAGNWLNNSVPTVNDYVSLRNGVTIPNGCLAEMKDVLVVDNSSVTIKDGGQLYVYHGSSPRANATQVTVEKNISAANGTDQTNWYLLSPPVYNNHFDDSYPYYYAYIATVENFTDGDYDMFRYKESEHKWQNKKAQGALGFFDMERGRGYLYRNAADVTISFTGTMTAGNQSSDNYHLSYTELDEEHAALQGFNLIGNPYTHNIYKSSAMPDDLETGFYKLADYGQWTACTDNSTIIGVGEAILVQAKSNANDRCLIFEDRLATSAKERSNNDNIMFTVANSKYSDVTYALFEESHGLTKISHRNAEVPMIYIPKNGENLAIATMSDDTKTFPLNFKAMTMGSYTLSCNTEGNFSYLHIVDRLTGEDVDMLLENEYSFIGAPNDRDDRFVVYLEYSGASDFSDIFAYQNGDEIIVSGEGTLQVFDVTGRMVSTQYINGVETMCTSSLQTGVYIFRLNGKTQKIVVR
jgi:hypothetical protein